MRLMHIPVAVLFVILGVAVAMAAYLWWQLEDVEMSIHGWLALTLGVVFTLLLGMGLMRLAYWSHHQGYDDRVDHDLDGDR